jgi:Putative zinc-finger
MSTRPRQCEWVNNWVSLRLDDELSEFEGVLLDAHLAECAACRTFAHDVSAFTAVLRSQPLEAPGAPVELARLPRLPRRSRVRVTGVAVAALIIVAVGAVEVARSPGSPKAASSSGPQQIDLQAVPVSLTQDDMRGVAAARRAHLLAMTSRWWIPRRGFQLT